jgi:hypothetical protein
MNPQEGNPENPPRIPVFVKWVPLLQRCPSTHQRRREAHHPPKATVEAGASRSFPTSPPPPPSLLLTTAIFSSTFSHSSHSPPSQQIFQSDGAVSSNPVRHLAAQTKIPKSPRESCSFQLPELCDWSPWRRRRRRRPRSDRGMAEIRKYAMSNQPPGTRGVRLWVSATS